jgi:hypothetical protein
MGKAEHPREDRLRWLGDAAMRAALVGVLGSTVVLSLGALGFFGGRAALGVLIGGALATINLWVFGRIGEALIARRGQTAPASFITLIKLGVLFGAVWLILKSGVVSGLSLVVGYGALPLGITIGSLFGPRPPDDDPEGRSSGDAPEEDVLKARPAEPGGSPSTPSTNER